MARVRKLHRLIGVVLLLPLAGWAVTGFIFFVKPGYAEAYGSLPVKSYPVTPGSIPQIDRPVDEIRVLKTVLGLHLLVREENGWQQLDPETLLPRSTPGEEDLRRLFEDAVTANPERYGRIVTVGESDATTESGARLRLDWSSMYLSQRGSDTDRIDLFYKIHYLQWTGFPMADRVLGFSGLVLLLLLSGLGMRLLFRP